jgi:hypothetical protein
MVRVVAPCCPSCLPLSQTLLHCACGCMHLLRHDLMFCLETQGLEGRDHCLFVCFVNMSTHTHPSDQAEQAEERAEDPLLPPTVETEGILPRPGVLSGMSRVRAQSERKQGGQRLNRSCWTPPQPRQPPPWM